MPYRTQNALRSMRMSYGHNSNHYLPDCVVTTTTCHHTSRLQVGEPFQNNSTSSYFHTDFGSSVSLATLFVSRTCNHERAAGFLLHTSITDFSEQTTMTKATILAIVPQYGA